MLCTVGSQRTVVGSKRAVVKYYHLTFNLEASSIDEMECGT